MRNVIGRRGFILGGAAFFGAQLLISNTVAQAPDKITEFQRGDPGIDKESLTFDKQSISDLLHNKGQFEPIPHNFSQLFVEEAKLWNGKNRSDNQNDIGIMLDLFNLPYAQNGKPVPFCAAGISYIAAAVYAKQVAKNKGNSPPAIENVGVISNYLAELDHAHFYPSPSVNDMYLVASGKHRWVPASSGTSPKPGWLVVYHWDGGAPDHVGIVISTISTGIQTIEFNTSPADAHLSNKTGGYVAIRSRKYPDKSVMGFIRTV